VGCTKEREMGTLATYVVVELDVGILNESEEVGELFVCFSSCQSFCAEAWGEEGRVGKDIRAPCLSNQNQSSCIRCLTW
jgi:hypothetical protein